MACCRATAKDMDGITAAADAEPTIAAPYRPSDFYIIAAILFLLMTTVLTQVAAWLHRSARP